MDPKEPFVRFWASMDERIAHVDPAWWGAVVTDATCPIVWDVNYARVETGDASVRLANVESVALPALEAAGAVRFRVVMFRPEATTELLAELGSRGDTLSWDLVMVHDRPTDGDRRSPAMDVEEIDPSTHDGFWGVFRRSLPEFGGETTEEESAQLESVERRATEVLHKRWFAIFDDRGIASIASLAVIGTTGYLDHVVTFAHARRRGFATAVVARAIEAARASGVGPIYLLMEPDGPRRLYEASGFRDAGRLAGTISHRHGDHSGGISTPGGAGT